MCATACVKAGGIMYGIIGSGFAAGFTASEGGHVGLDWAAVTSRGCRCIGRHNHTPAALLSAVRSDGIPHRRPARLLACPTAVRPPPPFPGERHPRRPGMRHPAAALQRVGLCELRTHHQGAGGGGRGQGTRAGGRLTRCSLLSTHGQLHAPATSPPIPPTQPCLPNLVSALILTSPSPSPSAA